MNQRFNAGDFIEVTPLERNKHTDQDFGVIRGTANSTLGYGGLAEFTMIPLGLDTEIRFSINEVNAVTLFRVARATAG